MSGFRARWWTATLGLLLLRLWLAARAPLGDDEGYYWVWSRHPAAGYYEHPPLVAWLVAASTSTLGVSLLSLRLPFVLLGAATAVALRALVREVTGDARLADRSSLLFQIVPVFFALGFLVIPDAPLLLLWLLVALAAWRATQHRSGWSWLATGLALAGAMLSKYVGLLLVVSLAGFFVATRRSRALGGLLAACAVAAALFWPVVSWNHQHEWASFRYQFLARHHGAGLDLGRFSLYLGSQALYLSPLFLGLAACAAFRIGPWGLRPAAEDERYLWWLAVPTQGVFLLAGAFTSFKPNWAAPGYLTLLPLILRGLDRWRERAPRLASRTQAAALAVAVTSCALPAFHLLQAFLPLPRRADPTADARGWPETAAAATRAMDALRTGAAMPERAAAPAGAGISGERAPFFAAGRYQLASRLEFYLPGHPSVVCLNPGRDAYDDWQRPAELLGRDFVFVSDDRFPAPPDDLVALRSSGVVARVTADAGPRASHVITIYRCRGFGERSGRPADRIRRRRAHE